MRKILAILALTVVTFSCEKDKGYEITGTAKDVPDGTTVYVSELNNNRPERVDSTTIKNGEFELDLEDKDNPNLGFLEVKGINGNVIFISENHKIDFKLYKDSLRSSEVTGGQENTALKKYLDHLEEVNKKMMDARMAMRQAFQKQDTATINSLKETQKEIMDNDKVFKKQIITNNNDSFVAVMALTDLMRMNAYPSAEMKKMYDGLSEGVKQNSLATSIKENLDKRSAVEIGAKAPDFSAPTPDGEELSLKDAMGKVTIIDFWAAWCKPCRAENPHVVEIYKKYHDKGLNIIGVSLDREGQKDKWIKAIEDDGLVWQHVSHLKFWQEPIAQKYGVRAIPATFILDENGKIVAKNLKGDALEKKIGEMLN